MRSAPVRPDLWGSGRTQTPSRGWPLIQAPNVPSPAAPPPRATGLQDAGVLDALTLRLVGVQKADHRWRVRLPVPLLTLSTVGGALPHVSLLVSDELLEELPKALALLNASEVGRMPRGDSTTVVTLDMTYAPKGAEAIEPTFQRTPDGVRVQSIVWQFTGPDVEDDPPVQCWHYEPDTPCDWDVCRQPERLAAGDYGTDPAEGGR